jgi:hypothetical protein
MKLHIHCWHKIDNSEKLIINSAYKKCNNKETLSDGTLYFRSETIETTYGYAEKPFFVYEHKEQCCKCGKIKIIKNKCYDFKKFRELKKTY